MPTVRTSFRLTESDLDRIDQLGRIWGPVQPLDRTAVIREAVRRARAAEHTKGPQSPERKRRVP
jgi:hypothetical protein